MIFYANCMKCQILLSGKTKKIIINLSSADLLMLWLNYMYTEVSLLENPTVSCEQPRSSLVWISGQGLLYCSLTVLEDA